MEALQHRGRHIQDVQGHIPAHLTHTHKHIHVKEIKNYLIHTHTNSLYLRVDTGHTHRHTHTIYKKPATSKYTGTQAYSLAK